jgi:hypothetical protein
MSLATVRPHLYFLVVKLLRTEFVVAPLSHTLLRLVTMLRKHGGLLHKLCDRPVLSDINKGRKEKCEAYASPTCHEQPA